jgi:hypothetical protein
MASVFTSTGHSVAWYRQKAYFANGYMFQVRWAARRRLARTCTCLFAVGAASPSMRWARAAGLAVQRDGEEIAICGVYTGLFSYPLYHMYATVRPHKS